MVRFRTSAREKTTWFGGQFPYKKCGANGLQNTQNRKCRCCGCCCCCCGCCCCCCCCCCCVVFGNGITILRPVSDGGVCHFSACLWGFQSRKKIVKKGQLPQDPGVAFYVIKTTLENIGKMPVLVMKHTHTHFFMMVIENPYNKNQLTFQSLDKTWQSISSHIFSLAPNKGNVETSSKRHIHHLESTWLATPIGLGLSWPRNQIATFWELREPAIDPESLQRVNHKLRHKKALGYFPIITGCLIGILMMIYNALWNNLHITA